MSSNSAPPDDTSSPQAPTQTLSSSFNGSGTTPRLLFTWDPYRNLDSAGPTAGPSVAAVKSAEADAAEEARPPSSGEEASTTSSPNHHPMNTNATATEPVPVAANAAQPPLTISSLLSGMGGGGANSSSSGGVVRSPQLSANAATTATPRQQSAGDGASAHSTPSGPVLKRIATSAKDGRQYFLDYSPTAAATATPAGTTGGMPNLMLPPNLSPHLRGVSPPSSALPQPQQQQQQQQQGPVEMEPFDLDHRGSNATSPQAIPLVSPPRSSSIGGSAAAGGMSGPGPYPYNAFHHTAGSGGYGVYGTSPQQRPQSSSLLGNSMNSGLLSGSLGSVGGMTQHNPYRTSPNVYPIPSSHTAVVVQRVQSADHDADLLDALEAAPSLFIKRLLPPPPPLLDVARVLPTPGVVQSLCERWCALVEAVLRSREFSDVTTAPPPPPPMPSPTKTSPTEVGAAMEGGAEGGGSAKAAVSATVQAELREWYGAAVEWYEQLDQAGAATVDIRASSRSVAYAIEVAASGRGRRGGTAASSNSASGRYHGQAGGRGTGNYRGGGGGGAGGNNGGFYGYQAGPTYRGGRGGGSGGALMGFHRGARGGPYDPTASSASNIRGGAHEMDGGDNNNGNTRNVYYGPPSNFNPYAESWSFSGDTHMNGDGSLPPPPPPPPPPMMPQSGLSKPPYMGKMTMGSQRGYAANPAMGPM